jgi:hypothetical protein
MTPPVVECILRAALVNEELATRIYDVQSSKTQPKGSDEHKIDSPGKVKSIFKKGTRPMDDVLTET